MPSANHQKQSLMASSLVLLAVSEVGCLRPPCEAQGETAGNCFEVIPGPTGDSSSDVAMSISAPPTSTTDSFVTSSNGMSGGADATMGDSSDTQGDLTGFDTTSAVSNTATSQVATTDISVTRSTDSDLSSTGESCPSDHCGDGTPNCGEECDPPGQGDCNADCTIAECGNGIPEATEECDDKNIDSGDYCDANCKRYGKLVFVTSGQWGGDLGGLGGAHQKCNDAAQAAELPGTYAAWLSIVLDDHPANFFLVKDRPYYLTDRTTRVAQNFWDLAIANGDDYIEAPISLTESGGPIPGGESYTDKVWTSTFQNGQPSNGVGDGNTSCWGWISNSEEIYGGIGNSTKSTFEWSQMTENGNPELRSCEAARHLYCFEQ